MEREVKDAKGGGESGCQSSFRSLRIRRVDARFYSMRRLGMFFRVEKDCLER